MKLGQGNIFTGVWGGGVCLSACWDTNPPQDQAGTPRPGRHPASACWDATHPQNQAGTPRDQAGTPRPGRHPPPQTSPTPSPEQSILGDMVNERVVCILLECNLVNKSATSRTQKQMLSVDEPKSFAYQSFLSSASLFIWLHYLNTSWNEVVRSSVWKVNVSKGIVHFINLSKIKDAISTRIPGFESHLCLYTYASIWIKWSNCHAVH